MVVVFFSFSRKILAMENHPADNEQKIIEKKINVVKSKYDELYAKKSSILYGCTKYYTNKEVDELEAIGEKHDGKKWMKECLRAYPTRETASASNWKNYCQNSGEPRYESK